MISVAFGGRGGYMRLNPGRTLTAGAEVRPPEPVGVKTVALDEVVLLEPDAEEDVDGATDALLDWDGAAEELVVTGVEDLDGEAEDVEDGLGAVVVGSAGAVGTRMPFPIVWTFWHCDLGGAGCAAGVEGWPWWKVEVP